MVRTFSVFLPPANEVWGKVVFLVASAIHPQEGVSIWGVSLTETPSPGQRPPGQRPLLDRDPRKRPCSGQRPPPRLSEKNAAAATVHCLEFHPLF